jgi:hypothetical protein
MSHQQRIRFLAVTMLLLAIATLTVAAAIAWLPRQVAAAPPVAESPAQVEYKVIAWNDLGMHCYNPEFQELAVLPPWNTLYAQVIRLGDPPLVVTSGLTVTFSFEDNTYSVGKTDFWDISPYQGVQNAQWLFKLPDPLPPDVGLAGIGLSGTMEVEGNHFKAEGIPLTEYSDSALTVREPFQLATVVVFDATTGEELARVLPVAPVSTEMHCENCHYDGGPGNEDIATGNVYQNILSTHDAENASDYPQGYTLLMDMRPVLCAWCHASPILAAPGEPGIPSFSEALHLQHAGKVPDTQAGCYNCHPGPATQCQRDVMYGEFRMTCPDCHGTMEDVGTKTLPWFEEPRCDDPLCHGIAFAQDDPLYRLSKEHGGMFCEACHDSTHAIAPSIEPKDGLKFIDFQGYDGTLRKCTACHVTQPTDPGPHGLTGAMAPAWEKEVWNQGVMVQPTGEPILVLPDGTVDVVDHVQVSGDPTLTFTMRGEWSDGLSLLNYQVDAGTVTTEIGTLVWNLNNGLADTWYTITRTMAISTTYGTSLLVSDTLTVAGRPGPVLMEVALQAGYRVYLPLVGRSFSP